MATREPTPVPRIIERLGGLIGSRAVVRNVQWLFLEKVLRIILGIVVGAWVARYLGPDRFGVLAYVVAVVSIFQAVAQLGIDSIVVRDIAQRPADASAVLGTALHLRLAAGVLGLLASLLLMAMLRPGDREGLALTALIAVSLLFQVADTVDLWFQSQLQSRLSVMAKIIAFTVGNGARVVAILLDADLLVFGALIALEMALNALAMTLMYRRLPTQEAWYWRPGLWRTMLRESWPLLTSAMAVLLYMRLDQIMIREIVGERELGIYSAAQQLSAVWYFLPMIVCSSLAPELARLHANEPAAYLPALRRLFSLCWLLSLVIVGVMLAGADLVVVALYGPAYSEAATVLRWHTPALIPVALGIAQSLWITHEKRPALALYRTVLGLVVSVALNLALIPSYGAVGSAVAYLCCQIAAAVLSNAVLAPHILRLQFAALLPARHLA